MFRQEHCALLFRPLEDRSFRCHGGLLQWNHLLDRTRCWNLVRMPIFSWEKSLRIPVGFIPFWWAIALVSKKTFQEIFLFFWNILLHCSLNRYHGHLHWGKLFLLLMDIRASRVFSWAFAMAAATAVDVADALRTLVTQRAMRRPSSASPVVHYSEIVPEHNEENRRDDWSSRIPAVQQLDHFLPSVENMEKNLAQLSEQRSLTYQAIQREVLDREKGAEVALLRCREAETRCWEAERQLERYKQNERLLKATQEEIRVLWMYVEKAKAENEKLQESLEEKDSQIEALQAELNKGSEGTTITSPGMPKVLRSGTRVTSKIMRIEKPVEKPRKKNGKKKGMHGPSGCWRPTLGVPFFWETLFWPSRKTAPMKKPWNSHFQRSLGVPNWELPGWRMVEVSCSWKTHFDKGKSKPYVFVDSTIAHHSATSSCGHFMNFMKNRNFWNTSPQKRKKHLYVYSG